MIYDGTDVVAEIVDEGNDGTVDRQRLYWILPQIDQRIGFVDIVGNTATAYYYITDQVGSVLQVLDSSGTVVNQYNYDAWGNLLPSGSFETVPNRYRFQGREWDENLQAYYFRYRLYFPETGTFSGPDPDIRIESGGVANYLFIDNGPLNEVDPYGLRNFSKSEMLAWRDAPEPVYPGKWARLKALTFGTERDAVNVRKAEWELWSLKRQVALTALQRLRFTGDISLEGAIEATFREQHHVGGLYAAIGTGALAGADFLITIATLGEAKVLYELSESLIKGGFSWAKNRAGRLVLSRGGKLLTVKETSKFVGKHLDEAYITVYHGTSRNFAKNIRENGISLAYSRAKTDFGKGFYTTLDKAQATKWAARASDGGEVIAYRVRIRDLESLDALNFSDATHSWARFVRHNRLGGRMHGHDIVSGPMLANPKSVVKRGQLRGFRQQVSWHSDGAIELLQQGLRP